jgi:hypothetical protein
MSNNVCRDRCFAPLFLHHSKLTYLQWCVKSHAAHDKIACHVHPFPIVWLLTAAFLNKAFEKCRINWETVMIWQRPACQTALCGLQSPGRLWSAFRHVTRDAVHVTSDELHSAPWVHVPFFFLCSCLSVFRWSNCRLL